MKTLVSKTDVGEVYQLPRGQFQFEAWGGVHISRACEAAALWSSVNGKDLLIQFNDIRLVVKPSMSAGDVQSEYDAESERRAQVYRASPAYVADQARNAEEVATCQAAVNAIVAELPAVLDDVPQLLECLCRLSDAADRIGVKCDAAAIADVLETKWKDNDCVGMEPEMIQASSDLTARWIIGQAINCLRHNMPPHPMIRTFTEKYLQMA